MSFLVPDRPGVEIGNTSLGVRLGVPLGKFFKKIGSSIGGWLQAGFVNIGNFLKSVVGGAIELGSAILRGDWGLLKTWIKQDPIAAAAGAGAVILTGAAVVGLVGIAAGGVAALVGGIGIGGMTLAGLGTTAITAAVGFGQQIYNFDFNKSDKQMYAEIEAAVGQLASTAGNVAGRALAGLVVGRKESPKMHINIHATAMLFIELEDSGDAAIAEDILGQLANLGWMALKLAGQIFLSEGYINFRQWARQNVRSGIPAIDKAIASWGAEGGQPWIISQKVNEVTAAISAENANLGKFLQGTIDGFGQGLGDFLVLEYH